MSFLLKDLLDIPTLHALLESLGGINNMTHAIIDSKGDFVTATALQNICTEFHRKNPDIEKKCIESDTHINAIVCEGESHFVYRCPMGLIDCATPIIIDGEHVGNVFISQFFMEQPDESYFVTQAHKYGFDVEKYLKAMWEVPIFSEEQLHINLTFIGNLVRMLAHQGLQRKKQLEYEAELKESEKKLKVIFDNVEAGIIVVSPLGIITFANKYMAEMFGMSLKDLIGANYIDLLHDSEKLAAIESMGKIIDGVVKSVELDRHFLRKDGTDLWGHLIGTRFDKTDGSMRDQIIVISDITEHKLAEEESKLHEQQLQHGLKMESIGVLAGGIAHDFNNILTVIIGNSYLAKLHPEASEVHINIIENAAEHAAGLCRQMLAYAGKATFDMADVNILSLVDDMVKMLKSTVNKNVVIKFVRPVDFPFIKGDVTQLGQIVVNLIINASEAIGSKQGEIIVALTIDNIGAGKRDVDHLGKIIPTGWYACLEVTDNGCGMDDKTKLRIFEPFYTTKFTGRGLGMSAVIGIISAHNGALQLSSQPGHGTTFKVYLPFPQGVISRCQSMQQIISSGEWQGSGKILLVEDSEQLLLMAKTMLNMLGFTVIEASNGKDALELYKKNYSDIAIVLTDFDMPIMNGYELFRALKSFDSELPIIISSGYGETVIPSRIENEEVSGIINKPYTFNQLKEVLKSVVENMSLKRA